MNKKQNSKKTVDFVSDDLLQERHAVILGVWV